jgi:hypothetical protein
MKLSEFLHTYAAINVGMFVRGLACHSEPLTLTLDVGIAVSCYLMSKTKLVRGDDG